MLIPVNAHCANVARVLKAVEDAVDWENVADWLLVAASVKSVDLDTIQHDWDFGYCSSADEFQMSREDLLQRFVTNISIFTFAWGALEAALEVIKPPKHADKSKGGKIRNACHYLKGKFESRSSVLHLFEEVSNFRSAAQACFGYEGVEAQFRDVTDIGTPGIGLYAVYKLRNSFAHGSLAFPMPDEENRPDSEHAGMVTHATRIVLLTLQMLLLAHFGESNEPVSFAWDRIDLSDESPLWLVLRGCHVEQEEESSQLSLLQDA